MKQDSSVRKNKFYSISNITDSMPKSYKKILAFVQENQDVISNMSITQLANKLQLDAATITRFCQSLGFSGYGNFKFFLKHNADSYVFEKSETFQESDSSKDTMEKVKNFYMQSIKEVVELLDPMQVEFAVRKICSAKTVHLYAQGGNITSAYYAQFVFWQMGIPCYVFTDPGLALPAASHLSKDDVAIGMCLSGSAKIVVDAMKIAKKNKATTIGIIGFPDSPIGNMADILLSYNSRVPDNIQYIPLAFICDLTVLGIIQAAATTKHLNSLSDYADNVSSVTRYNRYAP